MRSGVADLLVGLNAEQDVVALGVLLLGVMAVVGGGQRQAERAGQADELGVDLFLRRQAVVHELDVEALGTEDLGVLAGRLERRLVHAAGQADRPLRRFRQPDRAIRPLRVLGQEVLIDAGPVIEALDIGLGQQDGQVAVADLVLDEQDEVVIGGFVVAGLLLEAAARGDVDLGAEDRLDAGLLGRLGEGHGPEDVAVIGQGHRPHAVLGGGLGQVFHPDGPVQDAVLGMVVKMDEARGHGFQLPIRSVFEA